MSLLLYSLGKKGSKRGPPPLKFPHHTVKYYGIIARGENQARPPRSRVNAKSVFTPWTQRVPRPAGRIEGCGPESFVPPRYALRATRDAHSIDFALALTAIDCSASYSLEGSRYAQPATRAGRRRYLPDSTAAALRTADRQLLSAARRRRLDDRRQRAELSARASGLAGRVRRARHPGRL